jgi:adenylate cyclase
MQCGKCHSDNPAKNLFCGNCGTALANQCARCGAENPPTNRFCGDCGAPLAESSPVVPIAVASSSRAGAVIAEGEPAGERKIVTALFADLKGSTELLETLDPEQGRAIVEPLLRIMSDAARTRIRALDS